jgi:HNH endonuclease
MARRTSPLEQRFWQKVDKSGDCWLWTGATVGNRSVRYGNISRGRKGDGLIRAHRVSWELHFGPIPLGLKVLHHCDVGLCVRPEHLFLGTQKANVDDMIAKGRDRRWQPKGQVNRSARLTDAQIREIRQHFRDGLLQREIAAIYGLSEGYVSSIVRGRNWSHIDGAAPIVVSTHCGRGHLLDEPNTRLSRGRRVCRTCEREKSRRLYHQRRS